MNMSENQIKFAEKEVLLDVEWPGSVGAGSSLFPQPEMSRAVTSKAVTVNFFKL